MFGMPTDRFLTDRARMEIRTQRAPVATLAVGPPMRLEDLGCVGWIDEMSASRAGRAMVNSPIGLGVGNRVPMRPARATTTSQPVTKIRQRAGSRPHVRASDASTKTFDVLSLSVLLTPLLWLLGATSSVAYRSRTLDGLHGLLALVVAWTLAFLIAWIVYTVIKVCQRLR